MKDESKYTDEIKFDPVASKAERYEKGASIRKKTPLAKHQEWNSFKNRKDPVDILIQTSIGRVESLLPIRYSRMMESPFFVFLEVRQQLWRQI